MNTAGGVRRSKWLRKKIIRDENIVFVTDGFVDPKPSEADIEDLLDHPAVYDLLVKESYGNELKGKSLTVNPKVPRIVRRYEEAFKAVAVEFQKTRPARLLLKTMASDPDRIRTPITAERVERLFRKIADQLQKHAARGAKPFQ